MPSKTTLCVACGVCAVGLIVIRKASRRRKSAELKGGTPVKLRKRNSTIEKHLKPQMLYFHGAPGSSDEVAEFAPPNADIVPVDRWEWFGTGYEEGLAALAENLQQEYNQPLHLVGFSLGAMTTMRLAVLLGDQVVQVDIISYAAPLELGDFLGSMAGKLVFTIAKAPFEVFRVFTVMQMFGLWVAPNTMMEIVFSTAGSTDLNLAAQPRFTAQFLRWMGNSLGPSQLSYCYEVASYVQNWAVKAQPACQVNLFHGDLDTWAPLAMAKAWEADLGPRAKLHILQGYEHYSTLAKVLPILCEGGKR